MKKLLALVLALVMTLSLCTISNAAFTDAKDVTADYEEAVAVLNGMGVFKGYEDGSFKPTGAITRAEVAAIVYRLYTGDVKDKQADLYAGYGKFVDMTAAKWAAGYVGFCANAGFVKGYGDGKFGPSDSVTGYQALAMILRAVGYGKNGEFEGTDWELHVAEIAQQVGALKNVEAVSLKAAATRELVAELLFRVAADVNTVTYTPAFGYVSDKFANNELETETLGEKNFDLAKDETGNDDDWGRPAYVWYGEKNGNTEYNGSSSKDVLYATIAAKPVMTFTVATSECDICKALGEKTDAEIESVWTNGVNNDVYNYVDNDELVAKNTSDKVGAQGQLVEIFDMGDDGYRVVVIDTYLAEVTDVDKLEKDKNDHVDTPASISVNVFEAEGDDLDFVLTDDEANFNYKKGDIVLVNVNVNDEDDVDPAVLSKSVILGKADSKVAKQTYIYLNADKHEIGDKTYFDAVNFEKDNAGLNDEDSFTWYFDQYGNVIGSIKIKDAKTYGVIAAIELIDNKKTDDQVIADLVFMDGSKKDDVEIKKIVGAAFDEDDIVEKLQDNEEYFATVLFEISVDSKGLYTLTQVDAVEFDEDVDTEAAVNEPASIKSGVSKIADGVYADNDTMFLIRVEKDDKYSFKTVTGYEKIADFSDCEIDYVTDEDGEYAEYVFVKGDADEDHEETENFLFFTNKEAKLTLKSKDNKVDDDVVSTTWTITFTGAIDMNGKTDAVTAKLTIPAEYDIDKNALTGMIKDFLEDCQGMMFKANMVDGAVAFDLADGTFGLEIVDDAEYCGGTEAEVNDKDYIAKAVEIDDAAAVGSGVLKLDGERYNINSNTTYATEDGKGKATDLTNKVLENYNNAYVIVSKKTPTTAVAIFLTKADIAECHHDVPTFDVYVNGVLVGNYAEGESVVVEDKWYDEGTGYCAGYETNYFTYGTPYVVDADDVYGGEIWIETEYYLLIVDDEPIVMDCDEDVDFTVYASEGTYVYVDTLDGYKATTINHASYYSLCSDEDSDVTITTGYVKVTVYNNENKVKVSTLGTGVETIVKVGEPAFEYTNNTDHHVCVYSLPSFHNEDGTENDYYYGDSEDLVQAIELNGDLTEDVTTGTSDVSYYIFAQGNYIG